MIRDRTIVDPPIKVSVSKECCELKKRELDCACVQPGVVGEEGEMAQGTQQRCSVGGEALDTSNDQTLQSLDSGISKV